MTPAAERVDRRVLVEAGRTRLARERLLPFVVLTFGPRYQTSPVHRLIAERLEKFEADVVAGKNPRLMVLLPPRTGKSELVSRKFPAWCLGRHPEWNIWIVAYGAELAEKLSRHCRSTVMSDVYRQIFGAVETEDWADEGVQIDATSKAVNSWALKPTKDVPQPGGVMAVGLTGSTTGHGFNVLILDDTLKNIQEARSKKVKDQVWDFYVSTLYDRGEPLNGIIVVQQRWAIDDLPGRLLAGEDDDGGEYMDQWDVLEIPAQAEAGEDDVLGREPGQWMPGRRSAEQWERLKANTLARSPYTWYSKFQQRPLPEEGIVFLRDHFRFEDDDPDNEGLILAFADTSYGKRTSGDYSVIGIWRLETKPKLTLRLLHVMRERLPFPELRKKAAKLCREWKVSRFWIEDAGSGRSLIQEFMHPVEVADEGIWVRIPVRAWTPQRDGDKDARAHAASEVVAQGHVALPKRAPWLKDFLDEVCQWQGEGTTEHDDQVDMLSMALILMGVQEPAKRWEMRQVPFRIVA